jgi:hypothetical protein
MMIVLLVSVSSAYAEKSTELYIPIGQSPGLSGEFTITGKIDQVNSQNQTITLLDASSTYTVKLTEHTFIYLDKSKVQLINTHGTLVDCKVGDTIEVKWKDDDPAKPAEWIKVEKMQ